MARKSSKSRNMELRNDIWYFRKLFRGRQYHERLSADKRKAIKMRDDYLYELRNYGELVSKTKNKEAPVVNDSPRFGEVAILWSKMREVDIRQKQLKKSSMRDYRSIMNHHILPHFGNMRIDKIAASDVDDFIAMLICSPKRINNILVPLRSLYKMAKKRKIVSENIMLDVDNLKTEQPDIFPLDPLEVKDFLDNVEHHYKPFFLVAFFTGMRFGEMAGLKWKNVDFENSQIHIKESRVYGEDSSPKTKGSKRLLDIDRLLPVIDALKAQYHLTGKEKYVFRDSKRRLMGTDHIRNHVWKPTLIKAQLDYRPMLQTRHTFATIAIDAGEDIGWVQQMLGHSSLQMIYTRYYGWMKRRTRNDGSAFAASFEAGESDKEDDGSNNEDFAQPKTKIIKLVPKTYQTKKGPTEETL